MTLFSEQEDNNKAKAEAEAKVNIAVLILKSFMGCWGLVYIKIRKNISTGILEYWNTGILEYWNTGIPAFAPR